MRRYLALLVITSVLFSGCLWGTFTSVQTTASAITVVGTVQAECPNGPGIADVKVEVRETGTKTTTDDAGGFELTVFATRSSITLQFSHPDYQDRFYPVPLSSKQDIDLGTICLAPPGWGSIRGTLDFALIVSEAATSAFSLAGDFQSAAAVPDPREVLVTVTGNTEELAKRLKNELAAADYRINDRLSLIILEAQEGETAYELVERAAAHPEVLRAEVNHMVFAQAARTPNDPQFGAQWNLDQIYMRHAWDYMLQSPPPRRPIVAVLDTGVDTKHVDLAANLDLAKAVNVRNDGPSDNVHTTNTDHGTHVAGIIGAVTDNQIGIAGVAWNAIDVVPIKVLGDGNFGSIEGVVAGIHEAVQMGADVINLSLGIAPERLNSRDDSTLSESIQDAAIQGIHLVAAAGNRSTDPDSPNLAVTYPARFDDVMAIGAIGADGRSFEQASKGIEYDRPDLVRLYAPGLAVLSTKPGDSYGTMTGTSMAAPHAAGLVALLSAYGHVTAGYAVEEYLWKTGTTLTENPDKRLLNAYAALSQSFISDAAVTLTCLTTDELYSASITERSFSSDLPPGEYQLETHIDVDGSGTLTPGDWFHRQEITVESYYDDPLDIRLRPWD